MAAEGAFFRTRERDVNVRFTGRDDAARVQDFEWAFYSFVCVHRFLCGGGDVVIRTSLHGTGADHHIAVLDVLLMDDIEDGLEQEGIAIEKNAVDGLDLGRLENFGRRCGARLGGGERGAREESR